MILGYGDAENDLATRVGDHDPSNPVPLLKMNRRAVHPAVGVVVVLHRDPHALLHDPLKL